MQFLYDNSGTGILIYFILQCHFYYNFEKYNFPVEPEENRMVLRDERHRRLSDKFSALVEYGVLNRYSCLGYKNKARSNLRLGASFLLSFITLLFFLFICKLIDGFGSKCPEIGTKEAVFTWGAFLIAAFIIERKSLHEKWLYLASLYNSTTEKEVISKERKIMRVALAIDLLDMEMWSHRSFSWMFAIVLKEALSYCEKDNLYHDNGTHRIKIEKLNPIDKDIARKALELYQVHLIQLSNSKTS